MKILPSRSRPCCEPVVISTRDAVVPWRWAIHSRSIDRPSVGVYCSDACGLSANMRAHAAWIASTGKVTGEGRPPANEITSGRSVILRISRIAELVSCCARREKVQAGWSMVWSFSVETPTF